ncbi:MAG: YjbQ family protein [Alphaproteobacteria bacterium]|nr:YjbQ family protein [Alphaproteobacteria bacterium]
MAAGTSQAWRLGRVLCSDPEAPAVKQHSATLAIATFGPGLYDITQRVGTVVTRSEVKSGLATCFIRHTSASLVIQENADRDVLSDLEAFMRRTVSRDPSLYRHNAEGPDDMPSHIRSALTATSLGIPVTDGRMALGTWQAIYVFEHRDAGHRRDVVVQVMGE